VAITFDDGYARTLRRVTPVLQRCGVPATVFLVAGCLGREFWWDAIARVVLEAEALPRRLRLALDGGVEEWNTARSRKRLLHALYEWFRGLSAEQRLDALDQLMEWARVSPRSHLGHRSVTREELIKFVDGGAIEVGAHTLTHPELARLAEARQRLEIEGSKSKLEKILGRPVTSFSYPHGSWSLRTVKVVQESGFEVACMSQADVVRGATDRFLLPRFWVPNWEGPRFSRWLRRWLGR
jgi:peptidoglycan/xylan/chitin deacetylase (PgdA/CDA1 family)